MKSSLLSVVASSAGAPSLTSYSSDFASNANGWVSVRGGAITIGSDGVGPHMVITNTGTSYGAASFEFSTVIGETYSVAYTPKGFLGEHNGSIENDRISITNTWLRLANNSVSTTRLSGTFVATETTHYLNCVAAFRTDGILVIADVEIALVEVFDGEPLSDSTGEPLFDSLGVRLVAQSS